MTPDTPEQSAKVDPEVRDIFGDIIDSFTVRKIVDKNGTRFLDDKDQLHNPSGPAKISSWSGDKEWRIHGQLHRDDGPAIETRDMQAWYQHGKLHREDGPAVIEYVQEEDRAYTNRFYYLNGEALSESDYKKYLASKGKTSKDWHTTFESVYEKIINPAQ